MIIKTLKLIVFKNGNVVFNFAHVCSKRTNYMLLYSTLLYKKTGRAPGGGGRIKYKLTKVGGQNRVDPKR